MVFKCGTCGKQFADKGKMQQHAADAHGSGLAPKKKVVPRAAVATTQQRAPRRRGPGAPSGSGMGHLLDSGVDLLRSISVSASLAAGGRLFRIPLRPSEFTGRLHQEAAMWERWRPHSLHVEIVSSGSANTFGSAVVGWSADDSFELAGGPQDIARVVALQPSRIVRGSETARLVLPVETSRRWYNVHTDEDDVHGTVVGVVMNPFGGFTGSFGVTVMLHWKIEFEGVSLPSSVVVGDIIYPDAGWGESRCFTTTDTSFSATCLTFKETPGGNLVPYSGARPGVVYESLPGQKLFYYDSSSISKEFTFACRIPADDFKDPGLVFFLTYKEASEFCRTGDLTKTLQYTKAGEYCVPKRPGFKARVVEATPEEVAADIRKEMERLQRKLAMVDLRLEESGPSTSTSDARTSDLVQRVYDRMKECPTGTTFDPLKVISEDGATAKAGSLQGSWSFVDGNLQRKQEKN